MIWRLEQTPEGAAIYDNGVEFLYEGTDAVAEFMDDPRFTLTGLQKVNGIVWYCFTPNPTE